MVGDVDFIDYFATSKNFKIRPRTVFVEGITDVELFRLAAQYEKERTGLDLLGDNLAIVAAGIGDEGGTRGVCRELVSFKNMAKVYLLPNGRPKYRFIGLFDNDRAGRQAVHDVRKTDFSILEFKDVFRLWPIMPLSLSRDPSSVQKMFERENGKYKGLDWELEDLLPESVIEAFLDEFPTARSRSNPMEDKIHHEWTIDGKARLHQFVKRYAIHADLVGVIGVMRTLWHYLGINLSQGF